MLRQLSIMMLALLIAITACGQAAAPPPPTVTPNPDLPSDWAIVLAQGKFPSVKKAAENLSKLLREEATGTEVSKTDRTLVSFEFNLEGKRINPNLYIRALNVNDILMGSYKKNGNWRFIPLGYIREETPSGNLLLIRFIDPPTLELQDLPPGTIQA